MEEISSIIQELVQPLRVNEPTLDKNKSEHYKLLLDKCPLWVVLIKMSHGLIFKKVVEAVEGRNSKKNRVTK
jgi:hypothetical protein